MSQALQSDVLFYQRFLKCHGFYTDILDGDWGRNTEAAHQAFQQQTQQIAAQEGTFDTRSEGNIMTLSPKAQTAVRRFLAKSLAAGRDARVLSGTRTYAEQDALYAKGRTKPGPIVTNARGGQSNHNFGIAWDIGLFEGTKYILDDRPYKELAKLSLPAFQDLLWGGNWRSLKDYPHYELKPICNGLAALRKNFEGGVAYV